MIGRPAVATAVVDVTVHPLDTVSTRIQSPAYKTHYRQLNGLFYRNLFISVMALADFALRAGIPLGVFRWVILSE